MNQSTMQSAPDLDGIPLGDQDLIVSIVKDASQITLAAVRAGLLAGALDLLSSTSGAATQLSARQPELSRTKSVRV